MTQENNIINILIFSLLFVLFISPVIQGETILRGQDRGTEVKELQSKLKQLGYYKGENDGTFGVKTELSLKEFQKDAGLIVDGIAGPETLTTLDSMLEDRQKGQHVKSEEEKYRFLRRGDRGELVTELQKKLQQKGFLNGNADAIFGLQTELAVKLVQQFYGLQADGVVGPQTWEELNEQQSVYRTYIVKSGDTLWDLSRKWSLSLEELKKINNIKNEDFIKAGDRLKVPGQVKPEKVEVVSWHSVNSMIDVGDIIILTDVESGLSFRVKRRGGTNHADVEPLTARDTRVFKRIYGGDWSWERRAIIAHINGRAIAASINGQPHADQNIINNKFPGHICLHFKGSKLHLDERQDDAHQRMVEKAGDQYWPLSK